MTKEIRSYEFDDAAQKKLLHRDDVPMDMAEDVVAKLQALHPEAKVVFAGDMPSDDPATQQMAASILELEKHMDATFFKGLCWDCGKQIPTAWPPPALTDDSSPESEIDMPEGWQVGEVSIVGNGPLMLSCPECREKTPDGVPKPVEVPVGHKVGIRVGAIESMSDEVCRFYGYGEYMGDEVPPEDAPGLNIGMPNPKIKLDNGQIVWGCQCWWGPEEEIKAKIDQHPNVELVDNDLPMKE